MIPRWMPASALALLLAGPAAAQTAGRLGTLRFPNSGARAAQPAFLRGVLLLHSFEYKRALAAFREAQRADSGFALAYWGEAMTWTHPIWNEQALDSARATLARLGPTPAARRARAKTAREQAYLGAVELLYGEGDKPRRDTLYSEAMGRLALAYPADDEAKAFSALALMGLSQGVRNVPAYMRAGAIALDLFHRLPDHPGAAHYVIHAFDDPTHAPLGLPAARAYSRIAPDAMHAQHMTSHIFVAMGMWDETVAANTIASGPDRTRWIAGHPSSWLHYGLLQQGRHAEAQRLLHLVRGNLTTDSRPITRSYYIMMRAHQQVDAGADSVADEAVDLTGLGRMIRAVDAFRQGLAAYRRGDRAEAERWQVELDVSGMTPLVKDGYEKDEVVAILQREMRGLVRLMAADTARGLEQLREATKLEDAMVVDFGPPDVVKPSHELLGEILLAMGRAGEAQREFTSSLALAPRRPLSLLGLARSAAAAGDTAVSARAWADLRQVWRTAEPGIPGLDEAARAVSATGSGPR
ncbi:MAG TPA: hypothetical protein VFT84_10020 [Gemmatimonadales bacterium]|nr:hypothetical protein [Gemmatimonadales bacterium]